MTAEATLLDLLDKPRRAASTTSATRSAKAGDQLLNHLVRTGAMTETGLSRRARLRTCKCGRVTLAGLDDDTCALEAAVDPLPLSPLGEALARVEGRWTYSVTRGGRGWTLDRRDASKITYRPAGTQPRADVVREHRCGSPRLPEQLTSPTSFAEARLVVLPPNSPAPF